jgi:hypothetical protein
VPEGDGNFKSRAAQHSRGEDLEERLASSPVYEYIDCMGYPFPLPPDLPDDYYSLNTKDNENLDIGTPLNLPTSRIPLWAMPVPDTL